MCLKGFKLKPTTQWSQMVLNGVKKNFHKFITMVFITRFNLVLVVSKIAKMLTKKTSKRVRHVQVSWSSFYCSEPYI